MIWSSVIWVGHGVEGRVRAGRLRDPMRVAVAALLVLEARVLPVRSSGAAVVEIGLGGMGSLVHASMIGLQGV